MESYSQINQTSNPFLDKVYKLVHEKQNTQKSFTELVDKFQKRVH
jgi:hypothetical protein